MGEKELIEVKEIPMPKKRFMVEMVQYRGDLPSHFKQIWTYAHSQKQAELQAGKKSPGWEVIKEE